MGRRWVVLVLVSLLVHGGCASEADIDVQEGQGRYEDSAEGATESKGEVSQDVDTVAPVVSSLIPNVTLDGNMSNTTNETEAIVVNFTLSNDTTVGLNNNDTDENGFSLNGTTNRSSADVWSSDYKYEPFILENPEDSKFIFHPPEIKVEDITLNNEDHEAYSVPVIEDKLDPRFALGPKQQHQTRSRACSCCFKWAMAYNKEPNCATGICTCKPDASQNHEVQGKYCFSDLGVESFREGTEPEKCEEEDMHANICDY